MMNLAPEDENRVRDQAVRELGLNHADILKVRVLNWITGEVQIMSKGTIEKPCVRVQEMVMEPDVEAAR